MAEIAIVGAGIGGLAAALLLAREGRDVIVCERDPAPVPSSTEEMWCGWQRPGIPQARLGHTFLPGFRLLLREHAPDVLERLHAAGAPPLDFAKDMPGDERRPEDAELTALMCRRGVLEGILRQAVEAEPTVELRSGCNVVGLVAEPSAIAGVPSVTGVRTRDQGSVTAQTVILAGGRRVPVRRWFESIGAQAPAEASEGCGFVCFTRYFRVQLQPGEDHHVATQITVDEDLGYMQYEIYGADQSTFCVELAPPTWDHELRGLRHDHAHIATARVLPGSAGWLDADRATPIGPVAAMGEERNLLRHFTSDGRPIALGVHVIGDARCQTNSLYAWGSGSALAGAITLVDVLAEHHGDPEAQALAFEARRGAETTGRFELSLARDRAVRRSYHGESAWDDPGQGLGFLQSVVVPAADDDAEVFRAVMRWEMQLDPVGALAKNSAVLERARTLAAARERKPDRPSTPTRESVLQLIAAAGPAST